MTAQEQGTRVSEKGMSPVYMRSAGPEIICAIMDEPIRELEYRQFDMLSPQEVAAYNY